MRWLCVLALMAACTSSSPAQTGAGTCASPDCLALTPPTGVSISAGNQFALVRWNAAGGSVIDYRVTATPPSGAPLTHQEARTNLLFTGLTNGVAYSITVASSVAGGTGPASAAIVVTPQATCNRTFALYRSFPAGTSPTTVVAADLDNDGFPDLAVTQANGISVLRNDQAGNFNDRTDHPLAVPPGFLIAADFDSSGVPDLAAGGADTRVFFNDGAGGFDGGTSLGFASSTLAAGDLSFTGLPDLIAGSSSSVQVLVASDAGLVDGGAFAFGFAPGFVAAADFNADSLADLAVSNPLQPNLELLMTGPDGGLITPATVAAGNNVLSLAAADFDGDGLTDLATGGADGQLHLMHNLGGGGFAAPRAFDAGAVPDFLVAADLNFDAFSDLVYTASTQNRLGVLFNAQDGGFAPPLLFTTGGRPSSVAVADFNNDGFPDLAVANTQDGTISIYLNLCR